MESLPTRGEWIEIDAAVVVVVSGAVSPHTGRVD